MTMWSLCAALALAASLVADSTLGATTQCPIIEENTDYIGHDVRITAQATADGCCADCAATPTCTLYVWVQDGSSGRCILKSTPSSKSYFPGFCILKSSKGEPSTYPGARASFPLIPTPAPTPSKCPTIELNVDYAGNDILATSRANHADCCGDCERTPGCSLYVWANGMCYLKSKKGEASSVPGAVAAVLPVTAATTPLSTITSGSEGKFPLPTIAFNYIKGGQWIDQSILAMVQSQVESFQEETLASPSSTTEGRAVQLFGGLEAAIGLAPYINVTSAGDCAVVTSAYKGYFFTYLPSLLVCLVHDNTLDKSLQMLSAPVAGQPPVAVTYPQLLDDAFKSGTQANVTSSADCAKACQAKSTCAGIVYTASSKLCTFFQPKPSTDANVVAGWVNQAVWPVDSSTSVQYSRMPMSSLPRAYVTDMMPGAASLDACAKLVAGKSKVLFTYVASTKVCTIYSPTPASQSLGLVNTPVVPVVLPSSSFGADVARVAVAATTAPDCYRQCVPSKSTCFGALFDATTKVCTLLTPTVDLTSTLGWIIPKTLPTTMATVSQVDVYVTAHEDDHELFMSAPVYNSIKSPTTKSVFVYLSAGDSGETTGWWQAREVGTVAATKTWLNLFGTYSPVSRTQTVLIKGHNIVKIVVGNSVHYFLRLSEAGLLSVIVNNTPQAPLDQPSQPYANAQAVKDVLKAIIVAEATKVPKVTASYSKYLNDEGIDHVLHVASGRLTAELLNADALFKTCVTQYPYFGYQHWLDAVNMNEPERLAQRAAWVGLSVGILSVHPRNVWSEHSAHLGRTYAGPVVTKSAPCSF
ncbi:hypothetical protein DYB35_012628 [Aphanomyces astaci]|uniref:Apple domain-containing protein n=1 Tax=Aphanomyces astaci TaxID=112090 RepID=A0A418DXN6_APHAT|nr:hypothetical protein DYB35_012628 [Aphanomyces astaci]